jgi:hypothetical protein
MMSVRRLKRRLVEAESQRMKSDIRFKRIWDISCKAVEVGQRRVSEIEGAVEVEGSLRAVSFLGVNISTHQLP